MPRSTGPERVVVGSGPDALLSAAVLAGAGLRPVLVLAGGPEGGLGLRHPELPAGTGRMRLDEGDRALAERAVGALVEAPDPSRAVLAEGRVRRLPLSPAEVHRLFPREARVPAARAWARRRARLALNSLLGGGQEERTHRDWVVRRMGAVAWHHLYRGYAERRWGAPSERLGVAVARLFHGTPDPGPHLVAGGGPRVALEAARQAVLDAGGRVIHAPVRGLVVADGRVAAVRAGDEEVPVDGPLWVAASPAVVAGWLGEALEPEVAHDAAKLVALPGARVALAGDAADLPEEVHVLDERAPFWRVVTPYGVERVAIFDYTGPAAGAVDDEALARRTAEAAAEVGLGRFTTEGARVERLADHAPLWRPGVHAVLRRVLLAWRRLGIVAVGRGGAFRDLDPGEVIGLAARYAGEDDPDQLEVHRQRLMPPVWREDLDARITRFVER